MAKTKAGTDRAIPMSEDLYHVMSAHAIWFTATFGETTPEHYVFRFGSPMPKDPARPTVEIKTAWASVRMAAGVDCRWHDLRHTAATKLAEAGVPEGTFKTLFGWMHARLIERYSHVRMEAKREAVKAMRLAGPAPDPVGVPKDSPKELKTGAVQ
ncbi:MAG: tyrosine-type recombinase/integrase [Candidatus Hydrogenedentes bacterium]|nr:tyrosine-type recombinase/integrase [Candidatus Hydrogenedentota bacterium]